MDTLRTAIRTSRLRAEEDTLAPLIAAHGPDAAARQTIHTRATDLVTHLRADTRPGLMEVFLAEYGLSTEEGVALMCLAEALLRVPDADTIDALIEDKIAPSAWGSHLGHSASSLVNASTWALMLTGKVLKKNAEPGIAQVLRGAVRRLGEPVIRTAVARAMREMGAQFVLGQTIGAAMDRARAQEAKGYTYSYDMLGEAALTEEDAAQFLNAYRDAIAAIAHNCIHGSVAENPGISIKLSALYPRYETAQRADVLTHLVPRATQLARAARAANMGLNIDSEEADRLDLSLDVIEAVLADPQLAGWDGFGVVVQAYSKRAPGVIDWLHALATRLDRRIMVRLVKGAYWDTEIKRAQIAGSTDFPVYTRKAATDVAYVCCARKLLGLTDRIYPQFATHNAHSVAAVLDAGAPREAYEFQRLHGMGAALHDTVLARDKTRCRIYAPVGAHRDLLAYLVRRLLENGANSSFVNQIVDEDVPASSVAADPFETLAKGGPAPGPGVTLPARIYGDERPAARGWDLTEPEVLAAIDAARAPFAAYVWTAGRGLTGAPLTITNPAQPDQIVGTVTQASADDIARAQASAHPWTDLPATRAQVLNTIADLFEANHGEIFALLAREAGKTLPDAVAELREAVDFLRYYAARVPGPDATPRGTIVCISPWNFPLAIFTGQIAAALAAGNAVLAKPAEPTPLIADLAVGLMHQAGVPASALQLLPGTGAQVGHALTAQAGLAGVCFTGSTATAQLIHRTMAPTAAPDAPLIAETGGLNAMIVDSTALLEQATRDIVLSSFRSAGQRCSALRVLYVQQDILAPLTRMLTGAMDMLNAADPWDIASDLGPIITQDAAQTIAAHIDTARAQGRLVHQTSAPATGHFIAPALIRVSGIEDLQSEIFGPVLHISPYAAADLDCVVDAINASGFGLTFGMHSRIDDRVAQVAARLTAGNLYINRDQIGAVVGSQPFGGEGLSGTGPKAGGPAYVQRFTRPPCAPTRPDTPAPQGPRIDAVTAARALAQAPTDRLTSRSSQAMPGPTGESNRLTSHARGTVLCLGPSAAQAQTQADIAAAAGCAAVRIAPGATGAHALNGTLVPEALETLTGFAIVAFDGPTDQTRALRSALAARPGAILPLADSALLPDICITERHLCIDTTAAGGNTNLLAASAPT